MFENRNTISYAIVQKQDNGKISVFKVRFNQNKDDIRKRFFEKDGKILHGPNVHLLKTRKEMEKEGIDPHRIERILATAREISVNGEVSPGAENELIQFGLLP